MNDTHNFQESNILRKHSYPFWIYLFGIFVIITYCYTIYNFVTTELPYHRYLNNQIHIAEKKFKNKEYRRAFEIYQTIVNESPRYKEGKIRLAQICFALCENNYELFDAGFYYLQKERFTDSELNAIKEFVPKAYRAQFESNFKESGK